MRLSEVAEILLLKIVHRPKLRSSSRNGAWLASKQLSGCVKSGLLKVDLSHLKKARIVWLFEVGFNVSSGTAEWYRSSYGTDFENYENSEP